MSNYQIVLLAIFDCLIALIIFNSVKRIEKLFPRIIYSMMVAAFPLFLTISLALSLDIPYLDILLVVSFLGIPLLVQATSDDAYEQIDELKKKITELEKKITEPERDGIKHESSQQ